MRNKGGRAGTTYKGTTPFSAVGSLPQALVQCRRLSIFGLEFGRAGTDFEGGRQCKKLRDGHIGGQEGKRWAGSQHTWRMTYQLRELTWTGVEVVQGSGKVSVAENSDGKNVRVWEQSGYVERREIGNER